MHVIWKDHDSEQTDVKCKIGTRWYEHVYGFVCYLLTMPLFVKMQNGYHEYMDLNASVILFLTT
jgi:hypothetical protein